MSSQKIDNTVRQPIQPVEAAKPAANVHPQLKAFQEALAKYPQAQDLVGKLENRNMEEVNTLGKKYCLKAIGFAVAALLLNAAIITAMVLVCVMVSNPLVLGLSIAALVVGGLTLGLLGNLFLCGKCLIHSVAGVTLKKLATMQKAVA